MAALLNAVPRPAGAPAAFLGTWVGTQVRNSLRHAQALRPFRHDEFGRGLGAPSEGHLQAANQLIAKLRAPLAARAQQMVAQAQRTGQPGGLHRFLDLKEAAGESVRDVEKIWDFYFELFGQRQSPYAEWLLGCDRIAQDCYQQYYTHIGTARSVPAPGPFAYMKTGFSPATFRRGIPLSMLGRQINPFPLVQLPFHRLLNPWTLGAVLHEVSHNLQNDLDLHNAVPRNIARRLLQAGFARGAAMVWMRWNREIFADLSGLLLGGPAVVGSLMDVVGRAPAVTLAYSPSGVHPTPYLRTFLSIELLRRMGFPREANGYEKAWTALYPRPDQGSIPPALLKNFRPAISVVVDAICAEKYAGLGGRSLLRVIEYGAREQAMTEEAAGRLARGTDPGILPERLLIGAARIALERKLASPEAIQKNFYEELSRR